MNSNWKKDLKQRAKDWLLYDFTVMKGELESKPSLGLAIVSCMDTRVICEDIFRFKPGEALIIRNAGNDITEAIRSLVIAVYELSVTKIMILGYTNCGAQMTPQDVGSLLTKVSEETGLQREEILKHLRWKSETKALRIFNNVEANVREELEILRNHPIFKNKVEIWGLVYDVHEGTLHPAN